jgi:hypothetical protein
MRISAVSGQQVAEAVEAELKEYFCDAYGPTLQQYAIDHIIGGIVGRLQKNDIDVISNVSEIPTSLFAYLQGASSRSDNDVDT